MMLDNSAANAKILLFVRSLLERIFCSVTSQKEAYQRESWDRREVDKNHGLTRKDSEAPPMLLYRPLKVTFDFCRTKSVFAGLK